VGLLELRHRLLHPGRLLADVFRWEWVAAKVDTSLISARVVAFFARLLSTPVGYGIVCCHEDRARGGSAL
jgi:hypothetical protein